MTHQALQHWGKSWFFCLKQHPGWGTQCQKATSTMGLSLCWIGSRKQMLSGCQGCCWLDQGGHMSRRRPKPLARAHCSRQSTELPPETGISSTGRLPPPRVCWSSWWRRVPRHTAWEPWCHWRSQRWAWLVCLSLPFVPVGTSAWWTKWGHWLESGRVRPQDLRV